MTTVVNTRVFTTAPLLLRTGNPCAASPNGARALKGLFLKRFSLIYVFKDKFMLKLKDNYFVFIPESCQLKVLYSLSRFLDVK